MPTVGLEYTAKHKSAITKKGTVQVYDRFSFPLSGDMLFNKNVHYQFRFDNIVFNRDIDDHLFELDLPKSVILTRWDMSSADVSEAEMRAQASFDCRLPSKFPPGFAHERTVRVDGPIPAFTLVYRRGPQFVLVSMVKDTGLRPASEEIGIPVDVGDLHGRLLISPTLSSYTFAKNGTMVILTSNLPFDEILTIAASISF